MAPNWLMWSSRRTSSGPIGTPMPMAARVGRPPPRGIAIAASSAPAQGATSSSPTRRASSTGCSARSAWRPAAAAAPTVHSVLAAAAPIPAAMDQASLADLDWLVSPGRVSQ
jgi:hypothetical protein